MTDVALADVAVEAHGRYYLLDRDNSTDHAYAHEYFVFSALFARVVWMCGNDIARCGFADRGIHIVLIIMSVRKDDCRLEKPCRELRGEAGPWLHVQTREFSTLLSTCIEMDGHDDSLLSNEGTKQMFTGSVCSWKDAILFLRADLELDGSTRSPMLPTGTAPVNR